MTKKSESTNSKGQVQYINPKEPHQNPAFANVVTVTGPVRTVYVGGQNAVDTTGAIVGIGDFKTRSW